MLVVGGLVLVCAALLATTSRTAGGAPVRELEEKQLRLQAPPDGSTGRTEGPVYPSRNSDGQEGSGGAAVSYRSGGRDVRSTGADGRLFRTGYGAWEPSLGLQRDGTIITAARNSNVDPGFARSRDDGVTWERTTPPEHDTSLDPFVWVDPDTNRIFASDLDTPTCTPVSTSDDDGSTWRTSRVCGHTDYQKIFGGPPPADGAKPRGYPNVVYYCAITGGEGAGTPNFNACSKTLDGGATWALTGEPSYPIREAPVGSPSPVCDGGAPPGVVGRDGTVYLPRAWCGEPWISVSRDEGATWRRTRLPGPSLPFDPSNAAWHNDTSVAVDAENTLYYTWAGDERLFLSVSRDGGRTWSEPRDILPPGVTRAQNTAIDVGDPGKVAISFIGTRDPKSTPDAEKSFDGYLVQSTDAGAADPTFVAAPVNDPERNTLWTGGSCSPIRCGNMGDFYDVVIGPDGTPRASFVDSCPDDDKCTSFGVTNSRGEGVVGQLVGAAPLRGTVGGQTPGVALPAPASAPGSTPG